MASIDRSAMDAMKKDLSSNPRLRHQYGYEATAAAVADEDEPVVKKIAPKTTKTKSPKTVTTIKSAVKRKVDEPEVKIGKWQTVVEKKYKIKIFLNLIKVILFLKLRPVIVNTGFIDLQLPGSSSTASNKYESQVELEFQTEPIKKEEESGPPKSKWNPIGFQSIEQEDCEPKTVESTHIKEEIKQEPQLEPEPQQALYYTEPTSDKTTEKVNNPEKVVTLEGLFKSSKKPVSFKKRKTDSAHQNLRERKDD